MLKLLLVLFEILPRDTLKVGGFEDAFIRQFLYTPDETIQVDT